MLLSFDRARTRISSCFFGFYKEPARDVLAGNTGTYLVQVNITYFTLIMYLFSSDWKLFLIFGVKGSQLN